MKRTVKNFLILNSFFLLLIGCSNDDKVLESENFAQNDPVLQAIEKWGFSKDNIKDLGDYYLVDGDIVFYKDEKYVSPDSPSTKQRRHPNSVTISNINVFINPGMNVNWRNASTQAINRWNAVNSTLNLIVTTVPANAHIQIMYDSQDPTVNLGSSTFGRGTFPTANGLPGRTIWVNPDFDSPRFCGRAITQNMRITNVQHEIGHNVGITHTNQSFGSLIPGTPNADSQSVMNGGQACTIDNFSAGDITAIQFLFPVPLPFRNGAEWLNGPFNYSAYQFEVGDVNNDGRDDVVGIRKDDERVVVWLSNGNGFRSGAEWLNGPFNYSAYQFEVGDVNNDGREDVIGIRKDDERVVVWLSNGNGFRSGAEWLNGPFNYSAYQFEVGDVNNDGREDIIGIRKDDERVVVWLSNGNGFRSGAEWLNGPFNYSAYQFEVGDVNNDGREDVIGIRKDDERVVVWLSNGNGFRSGAEWLNGPFNYSAYQFEVGDVNNDGREDVIGIRKDDERAVVWLSNGNGFRSGAEWLNGPFDYSSYGFHMGDVNNDGESDIVGVRKDDERVVVWLNR